MSVRKDTDPVVTGIAGRLSALGGRSPEEIIILWLCLLGTLGVTPFLIARLAIGDILLAAVNSLTILGVALIAARVWVTREVRPYNAILSIFYPTIMVTGVHLEGLVLLGWAYPTLMVPFFLLSPHVALGIGLVALISLLPPIVRGALSPVDAGTVIVTLSLTVMFAWVFAVETSRQRRSLHTQAYSDPLTRARNRRALEDTLRHGVDPGPLAGKAASLILFDLDHFKQVNDEYGHETGDALLVELVDTINERLRRTDVLFRIGGEEFVVLAIGADAREAYQVAEDLRALVEGKRFTDHELAITISLGFAEVRANDTASDWLKRADLALYEAKRQGRNAVRCHDAGSFTFQ